MYIFMISTIITVICSHNIYMYIYTPAYLILFLSLSNSPRSVVLFCVSLSFFFALFGLPPLLLFTHLCILSLFAHSVSLNFSLFAFLPCTVGQERKVHSYKGHVEYDADDHDQQAPCPHPRSLSRALSLSFV